MKESYTALYSLLEADPLDHFIFTSSVAEGVNHVVFSVYLDITRKIGKNHFLCSSLDEAPAILSMTRLQEMGCTFQMIPADTNGRVTKEALEQVLTPRTAMVSVSWANSLTGVVQPVQELGRLCKEKGIFFHVDATHVLGTGYSTFSASGADALSFGCGALPYGGLFISKKVEMSPFILGGNEQASMRAGLFSLSDFQTLSLWAKATKDERDTVCTEVLRLRNRFETLVTNNIKDVQILFEHEERVPHISALLFPGVSGEALLFLLKRKGVEATYGGNHLQHMMHLLNASGISPPLSYCGLSFSFSQGANESEVNRIVERVADSYANLRRHSLVFDEEFQ